MAATIRNTQTGYTWYNSCASLLRALDLSFIFDCVHALGTIDVRVLMAIQTVVRLHIVRVSSMDLFVQVSVLGEKRSTSVGRKNTVARCDCTTSSHTWCMSVVDLILAFSYSLSQSLPYQFLLSCDLCLIAFAG